MPEQADHPRWLDRFRWLLIPAAGLGALGVFAKIAREVQERETTAVDRAVSLTLHRLDSPWMDAVMLAFTFLGSFPAVAAVVVAVAIWRVRSHDRRSAVALVLVVAVTELLNLGLKEIFQRPRPSLFQEIATLHSYSFPSGHAMASAAVYGSVAGVLARAYPAWRRAILLGACSLVLLIGLSRVYLGVHWITDVLAGWAAGAFIALAAALAAAWPDQ
ncbi:MAG TPA: phosphatase PAP2 family protein [Myxococcales bacterium]|nr:phosphatase PAP2 family protein [Myxococcales bacterium]